MTFGERLKNLRQARGLTQGELAKNLEMTSSAIGMYERGLRTPNFETLEMLADFFNVDIDFLLGREDHSAMLLDAEQMEIVNAYGQLSEDQKEMVRRLLGL